MHASIPLVVSAVLDLEGIRVNFFDGNANTHMAPILETQVL